MKYIDLSAMLQTLPHILRWNDAALYSKHYHLPDAPPPDRQKQPRHEAVNNKSPG